MVDWISDSDDSDKFEWDSEGDGEEAASFDAAGAGSSAPASRSIDDPGPSTQNANGNAGSSASSVLKFVRMGFTEEIVLKAIKENGDGDADSLLDVLLTYKAIGDDISVDNGSASACAPRIVDNSDDDDILENWDDEDAGGSSNRNTNSDDSGDEEFLKELSQKDEKVESLLRMGFAEAEAKMAITRCGQDASMSVLLDSICASEAAGDGCYGNFSNHEGDSYGGRKKSKVHGREQEKEKDIWR
uniref:UBA domain-containing protein n=1 Tax=Arundo donax TaxID=35708 RepID=A0A0A9D9D0_ARUDO